MAEKPPSVPRSEREKELEGGAMRYASLAVTIGAPDQDALEQVRRAFSHLRKRATGGPA